VRPVTLTAETAVNRAVKKSVAPGARVDIGRVKSKAPTTMMARNPKRMTRVGRRLFVFLMLHVRILMLVLRFVVVHSILLWRGKGKRKKPIPANK
jgi:hypothetical protein